MRYFIGIFHINILYTDIPYFLKSIFSYRYSMFNTDICDIDTKIVGSDPD